MGVEYIMRLGCTDVCSANDDEQTSLTACLPVRCDLPPGVERRLFGNRSYDKSKVKC